MLVTLQWNFESIVVGSLTLTYVFWSDIGVGRSAMHKRNCYIGMNSMWEINHTFSVQLSAVQLPSYRPWNTLIYSPICHLETALCHVLCMTNLPQRLMQSPWLMRLWSTSCFWSSGCGVMLKAQMKSSIGWNLAWCVWNLLPNWLCHAAIPQLTTCEHDMASAQLQAHG